MAAMVSETISELRVRYAETDQMGVVYHANYLVWCELGRTDFIRALGKSYAELEREGVLHTQVVHLQGKDPTVELPVQAGWGPNVYVSVLALRGRLYEVPWYSFFTWGYKVPRQWWNAFWYGGKEYVAPTALVDLSKPAFRLGVAELKVQDRSQQLTVAVQADKASYQVRDKAKVTIRATLPDGKPAAHAVCRSVPGAGVRCRGRA
jgi:hypothetical protein